MSQDLIDKTIAAAVVAALSALALVAYRHHRAFRRHFPILAGFVVLSFVVCLAYRNGVSDGFSAVSPFFDAAKVQQALTAFSSALSSPGWLWFGHFGALAYLVLLRSLPQLLNLEDKPPDEPQQPKPEA